MACLSRLPSSCRKVQPNRSRDHRGPRGSRGQYRFAVASGESRDTHNLMVTDTHPTLPRTGTDLGYHPIKTAEDQIFPYSPFAHPVRLQTLSNADTFPTTAQGQRPASLPGSPLSREHLPPPAL